MKVFHGKADSKSRIRGDDLEVVANERNRIGVVACRLACERNRESETSTEQGSEKSRVSALLLIRFRMQRTTLRSDGPVLSTD